MCSVTAANPIAPSRRASWMTPLTWASRKSSRSRRTCTYSRVPALPSQARSSNSPRQVISGTCTFSRTLDFSVNAIKCSQMQVAYTCHESVNVRQKNESVRNENRRQLSGRQNSVAWACRDRHLRRRATPARSQPFQLTHAGRNLIRKAQRPWKKAQDTASRTLGHELVQALSKPMSELCRSKPDH